MILGDMGADVLKVENPGNTSGRRAADSDSEGVKTFDEGLKAFSSTHNPLQRNKRSIALNLKDEKAKKIFFKLVENYDVLVEEFRPGVAERLGIDYNTLKEINPRLIYCAVTGFGQNGPYSQIAGHDINYISIAGILGLIGESADSEPVIPLNMIGDLAGGGMQGALGVLLALVAREKTGKGQMVDISMTDGALTLIATFLSDAYNTGIFPRRGGTFLSGNLPYYRSYPAKDGKFISVGCMEPWFYANLCRALGKEEFITAQNDPNKYPEMEAAFREAFSSRTQDEWMEILNKSDLCASKVYDLEEVETDPQIAHRKMIVELDHPSGGKIKQVGISIKLSDTPGEIKRLAPVLGEHTEEELLKLGYAKEGIEALRQSGAIA